MDLLEKNIEITSLYDVYQNILTEKQMSYFESYYFDDLSISEISENMNVSRNAVHDQLKRTVKKLHDLEMKLNLKRMKDQRKRIYDRIRNESNIDIIKQLIDECEKVE